MESEREALEAATAKWVVLNRAVWPRDGMTKEQLVALMKDQLDEFLATTGYHEAEELADMVSIAARAIQQRGFDVAKTVTLRLLTRHLEFAEGLPEGWGAYAEGARK